MKETLSEGQPSQPDFVDGKPLVSICMPTYKRTKFLREALESALAQTYPNLEIFVSDDTQSEEISGIAASYSSPRLRYQQNRPPLGFIPKLNHFLTEARGAWMVILCDDDILEPEFVARMVANAERYPEASLLRARNVRIDIEGKTIQLDPVSPMVSAPSRFLLDLFKPQSETFWVNLSGYMFKPQTLLELGGFTELYAARHADRLAWSALAKRGPVVCDEQALCKIRLHGASISSLLESGYDDALAATQTAREQLLDVLQEVEGSTKTAAEREEIAAARLMLDRYANEHVSRALRHGLISELTKPDCNEDKLRDLRERWVRLGVPSSKLTRLVLAASRLPQLLRRPVVSTMMRVRQAILQ